MIEESKSIAQVKLPELINFRLERIRVLHWTWFAFFIAFFTWFNMAPLATTMLKSIDWLTGDHIKVLAICNVAMTIPARILIGALIDRFGPRITFSALLVAMSVPTFIFAFGDTWTVLLISRLVLSSIGASFVIGIRMTAEWFPPKDVGKAEGFYAGWGNFGSAGAAMVLPWFALTFFGGENGWRYALALSGAFCLGYGILYFFVVRDTPQGKAFIGAKKTQPMEVSTWGDLVQLILWSFPLVAALGILAWRMNMLGFLGDDLLYVTYAVLGFVYIAHCGKILQVNVPLLRKGVPENDRYHFSDVAALNTTYIANFGAELAVVSMLPAFFEKTFSLSPTAAGLIASSFAFVNLFARPFGGWISDKMKNRKRIMLIYMLGIAVGFFFMGSIDSSWPLWVAVAVTIGCSMFVQGAEGATFAIVPLIKKRMTGQVAGMAGAYGNVGAVLYTILYSFDWVTAERLFFIMAGGAFVSFLVCLFFLGEPKDAFAEDYALTAEDIEHVVTDRHPHSEPEQKSPWRES